MNDLRHRFRSAGIAGTIMLAAAAASADTSVTMDFASGYVFRGLADDNYVFQPGIETYGLGVPEKYGFLTAGMWGNYELTDNNEAETSSEFSEIDLYAYYMLPTMIERWDFFIGFTEYIYPNTATNDNSEVNFGIMYGIEGLSLSATAYLGVGGDFNGDWYYSLTGSYSLFAFTNLEILTSVQVGYSDPEEEAAGWNDATVEIRFTYWLTEAWYIAASSSYVSLLYDTSEYEDPSTLYTIYMLRIGTYF